MNLPDLIDTFELLDDWSEKYRTLIELGRELPPFPEAEKTAENKVLGCQSQVWVIASRDEVDPSLFRFRADSDAHIVRGLVALVLLMYDGKTSAEIDALDPRETFATLGLDRHLSQGRTNGLLSMVGRIKRLAAIG